MALRDSMVPLIGRVRDLIGDAANATTAPAFDDVQIQQALDEHKQYVRYAPLRVDPTRSAGGLLNYNFFVASVGDWETDATLYGPSFNLLTPATSDYLAGVWTFSNPAPGQPLPVFITGQTYDIYAAAVDLLRRLAAQYIRSFTFSADGATFQRGAIHQQILTLAAEYERLMRPRTISTSRSDLQSEDVIDVPVGIIEVDY